jgi:putative spermidine/putrescine transport system substrate-binding protein
VKVVDLPNTEPAVRASPGNPQYNMAWVGYFQAANLYKDGMIETFDESDFPELKNVPDKYVMKAPDGKIIGVPVQFQYYGIAYNTKMAQASDFSSWMALTDPKWKGKLAEPQAFVSATYDLVMFAKIAGGDERNVEPGIPALKAFNKNALTVLTSFAQGNTLLSRGEVAALPFYSARVEALKKDHADVDIVIPKEGAVMLTYMLVVPKGAKDRDAYMAFLRYATKPEGQLRMLDYSAYIPFNTSAKLTDDETKILGMPLQTLMDRLYQPDYWVLAVNQTKYVDMVEKIQAEPR